MTDTIPYDLIDEALGFPGQMLSGDKGSYARKYPDRKVFFNACVFDKAFTQIWYGDIDFTLSTDALTKLAAEIGTIYVTREMPYRFEGLDKKTAKSEDVVRYDPT